MPALLTTAAVASDDLFTAWLDRSPARSRVRGRHHRGIAAGLRFAFYGRISTDGYQDPASSRQWQYDQAVRLTAGHGPVVAEYFDVGYSRSLPWHRRPHAAALLRAVSRPDRGFDAVVIGEYERAFVGHQPLQIIPYLQSHGVAVWLPEADGPIDLTDPTHRALIMLLGHQSEREVLRARRRTTQAMSTQARDQGRHLGGRPPYGYRLVDAGPHPNRIHAQWGRRLHRLDPDPVTAGTVRWIFARRLAGASTASIARALNERHIPPPSAHDPARNKHRGWNDMDTADGDGNPGQPALHRPASVEPAAHRPQRDGPRRQAHQSRAHPGVEPAQRLGVLRPPPASRAGQRRRLPRRPSHHGHRDSKEPDASLLPADRAADLRHLRAATRRPLDPRPGRLPVPARPNHHTAPR